MLKLQSTYLWLFSLIFLISCQSDKVDNTTQFSKEIDPPKAISFSKIDKSHSNVDFSNNLVLDDLKMFYDYINVFNGGGVAIGDINNDALPDLFFTGNLNSNKLYINEGDFKFTDISEAANIESDNSWCTGVTMADVNADGLLDIYVCRSYHDEPQSLRKNQLFINKGSNSFSEEAEKYGIADHSYSMQSSFFDYDKDGDLDLYVANHPRHLSQPVETIYQNFSKPGHKDSDHLYRNNGDGTFDDVTKEAGILNYGWSLSLSTSDINGDGWPDIYVSVDHDLPDKYYINQKDGTFKSSVKTSMAHISLSSMGLDVADINNDQLNDVFVVDMLSQDNYRQKTQMGIMNPKKAENFVERGYHIQSMRNMLQLNRGSEQFSEIGQMSKVSMSDWSWAALLVDLDNDGWKDIFVSNGYYKNFLDKDKLKEFTKINKAGITDEKVFFDKYIEHTRSLGSSILPNICFQNRQDLKFDDISSSSGLDFVGISTGAAYADLDNDGDLDMVLNNIDAPATILSNQSREQNGYNFLKVKLNAPQILGSVITVNSGAFVQKKEVLATRGYISSVDTRVVFGVGTAEELAEVQVKWPNGSISTLNNVKVNQELEFDIKDAKNVQEDRKTPEPLFEEVTRKEGIAYRHREKKYDDYKKQILLPHKLSQQGPFIAKGDVNGDKLQDIFIGGAAGQSGAIYVQEKDGTFKLQKSGSLSKDKNYEDLGAAFADFNGDKHLDLYVSSGGYEFKEQSPMYQDRVYLNDGAGNFTRDSNIIPENLTSSSCVKPMDFDGDGDTDIFVGGRLIPGSYPLPTDSKLLENKDGRFISNTELINLNELGMVTDAEWVDINNDDEVDLVVVGEWMSPKFFIQEAEGFKDKSQDYLKSEQVGWWNTIEAKDLNQDGKMDFVLGNLGQNYKYTATDTEPFHIYGGDMDDNGSTDIILGYFEDEVLYPLRGKQCSSEQIPMLNDKFKTYDAFARATIRDVYGDKLDEAYHRMANKFESVVLLSSQENNYEVKDLPIMAQVAPINAILIEDFDQDGNDDLLVGGNLFVSEVETGRADAGQGLLLKGDGQGEFVTQSNSGLYLKGDVKDIIGVKTSKGTHVIATNNNAYLSEYILSN